ncbi:unnamed protein product [Cunninghamella echinulata]
MFAFRQSIYQNSQYSTVRRCLYFIRTSTFNTSQYNRSLSTTCILENKQKLNLSSIIGPRRIIGSHLNTTHRDHRIFYKYLTNFPKNIYAEKRARQLGIPNKKFFVLSEKFVKEALAGNIKRCTPKILTRVLTEDGTHGLNRYLSSTFNDFAEPYMPKEVQEEYNSLRKLSDLRFPSEWFPEARQMQRKIYLHVGPTNSGKTYKAIQRLQTAESGIYCGPLRLLAHEIYDKMNAKGIPCNLLTGEEKGKFHQLLH